MKKIICFAISVILLFNSLSFALTFSDTEDSWANEYIAKVVSRGIFNGYPDGTFRPENNITRIEFMVALNKIIQNYTILTEIYPEKIYIYSDLNEADWAEHIYKQFMTRANLYGSLSSDNYGLEEMSKIFGDNLQPNRDITREEAVAVMNIFLDKNVKFDLENNFSDIGSSTFPESIKIANKLGIVNGYEDGTFRPFACITRAEAATILAGLSDKTYFLRNIKVPVSEENVYTNYLAPVEVVKQILKYEDKNEFYNAFCYYNPNEINALSYTYLDYMKNPFLHAYPNDIFLNLEEFKFAEEKVSKNEIIVKYTNPKSKYVFAKTLKQINGKWYASFDVNITL